MKDYRIGTLTGIVGTCLVVALVTGCNTAGTGANLPPGGASSANAKPAIPANLPPAAQAGIQKGMAQGQADGAAYAARMNALMAQKQKK